MSSLSALRPWAVAAAFAAVVLIILIAACLYLRAATTSSSAKKCSTGAVSREIEAIYVEKPAPALPDDGVKEAARLTPALPCLGWGRWFTLQEVEDATAGFAPERAIGEGGHGAVYRGVLADGVTEVAVKNLAKKSSRGEAEREFMVEVEAIGRIQHKNLVRLLGYCVEGFHRILVYEFVGNGSVDRWLHAGDEGGDSPLTWDIRMGIVLGAAKGLAYMHEGLEPKLIHRDIKASNVLLDAAWSAKISDFGIAKMLAAERSYVTTRVMGTFGYVAPEYASTGMLTEKSDVYSFGVLVMEVVSGRRPIDYGRPAGEVKLVDWLKKMIGERKYDAVVDARVPEKPPARALKKALLVGLRCVDPEAQKRPAMGDVVRMLELDDFPYRDDRLPAASNGGSPLERARLLVRAAESGESSGSEIAGAVARSSSRWRESRRHYYRPAAEGCGGGGGIC